MVGFPPFFFTHKYKYKKFKMNYHNVNYGYKTLIFFDDNLQVIKQMNKELNIKIHIVKL